MPNDLTNPITVKEMAELLREIDAFLCHWKMNHVPGNVCIAMIDKIDAALARSEYRDNENNI